MPIIPGLQWHTITLSLIIFGHITFQLSKNMFVHKHYIIFELDTFGNLLYYIFNKPVLYLFMFN